MISSQSNTCVSPFRGEGTPQERKCVLYLHHERDSDGDLIFYFIDPSRGSAGEILQSSPIVEIRRSLSAVIDLKGDGEVGKYVILTRHSAYEVQMPRRRAEQMARALGRSFR